MQCPVCSVTLNVAERQGIEIDYCPKCRGVWLDRGELDKIIERSTQMAAPAPPQRSAPPPSYAEPYRRHDDEDDEDYRRRAGDPDRRRKRGGFLGELFDFD